jgi:hypothetical protein
MLLDLLAQIKFEVRDHKAPCCMLSIALLLSRPSAPQSRTSSA